MLFESAIFTFPMLAMEGGCTCVLGCNIMHAYRLPLALSATSKATHACISGREREDYKAVEGSSSF